jgi:CRP-like cAMP-binding protein
MAASRRAARQAEARSGRSMREGEAEVDPAFQRAILKVALELRKPGARSYAAVVEDTVRRMRLDAGAFRRYLGENGARNMSLLLAAARRFGP